MKQIQDSLLERYKARQVKKLAIGGWMQQDWTGTKKPMSVEDQQLNGVDVTTNFNSYGTAPVASSTQPTGEFTDGFGDSMTVGEEGSGLTTKQGSSLMSGIVNVGTGAIMAANKKNNNPNSKYTNAGYYKTQTAASGASTGASLGASFGPIGIAAGAVIGGVAGYAVGAKKDKQAARDFSADQAEFRKMRSIERDGRSAQQGLFQNGSASQYYKNGGNLPTKEGSLLDNFKRTSSSTAEVHGPSHEQGGVLVPGMNAEVEGGETLAGDYVFSDELGFAKLHKPIALAKGKIEKKPATRERLNTLKLLNEKENNLKLMQEYVKSKNNLQ